MSVLVGASLPWCLGVAEVDVEVGIYSELSVLGHFGALVPGQRPAELFGQGGDRPGDRVAHGLGAMTRERGPVLDPLLLAVAWHWWEVQQHREPRRALNKRPNRGTVQSENQVTFPVSGHCPVFDLWGALADHDLGSDEPLAPLPGLSNCLCEGVGSWVFSGLGLVGWGSGFRVGLGLFSSRECRCRGFLLVCW